MNIDPESPERATPTTPSGLTPTNGAPMSETAALTEHLSYPAQFEQDAPVASTSSSAQPRTLLKDRLYVGNLHPSVDEYALLKVFSKYGNISKLDFLFHKSGPLRGKPRGYAFVEYNNKDDADRALSAHDKLLRGRKLVVTYANQAPLDPAAGSSGAMSKNRRATSEVGKPTTLSLLKSAGAARSNATDSKIARMEAKLRQLEGAAAAGAGPSLRAHPSLPLKPVAAAAAALETPGDASRNTVSAFRRKTRAPPLPSLPILPKQPEQGPMPSTSARAVLVKKSALSGVKIVKAKKNTNPEVSQSDPASSRPDPSPPESES